MTVKAAWFACLLSVSSVFALPAQAELPPGYKVVLQTENFPPFNMADNEKNFARDANIQGVSTTIVREMFKRAGIDYTLTLRFPWSRVYDSTLANANHGLFSTSMNEARRPLFKWVGPIAKVERVLLAAPGSNIPNLKDLEQARQYRIGSYKDSAASQTLEKAGLQPINTLRDPENIAKLTQGRIDLWGTTDPVWRHQARQADVTGLRNVLTFDRSDLYLALNLDTPDEVVARLQKALDEMKSEGYGTCNKHPELC
ncbi:polar amino acid transport system substrate-binding protein [Pseudomonas sp. BIGb0408]|uniref:Polar amino acid transport system substrate-binding protein n=1 Tax=Phytopseudomonas flavescens TaxID=29435 RepID=A0A7Y9XQK5_9GAMM|nr:MULTISPECIES: ABC transporter substrate-binding protein [Pseudomonas]MCW2295040.1 polar amino acid transport system substrate-binding protein [Pseudomonas sp. BIGb0408]NYH75686.1 polar amino acid transport system substrate-binding protein [Pseudomonas flavescens]